MKKYLRWVVLIISLAFEVMGVLSLLYISKIANFGFLAFYDNVRLIVRYIIAIVFMAGGIISFTLFAGMFDGKAKNVLSIGCTTYSTILTIPLLYVFVGLFFANKVNLPLVSDVYPEFIDIFKTSTLQYVIYALGVIMSLIFIAVPILSTVLTVKDISISNLFKKKSKTADAKHFEEK